MNEKRIWFLAQILFLLAVVFNAVAFLFTTRAISSGLHEMNPFRVFEFTHPFLVLPMSLGAYASLYFVLRVSRKNHPLFPLFLSLFLFVSFLADFSHDLFVLAEVNLL